MRLLLNLRRLILVEREGDSHLGLDLKWVKDKEIQIVIIDNPSEISA